MLTAQVQQQINDYWKPRKKEIEPAVQRKHHLCPKCGKKGFKVKMDYHGNRHVKHQLTVYDVEQWMCPRCHEPDIIFHRIEGTGKAGVNLGKMYGGI